MPEAGGRTAGTLHQSKVSAANQKKLQQPSSLQKLHKSPTTRALKLLNPPTTQVRFITTLVSQIPCIFQEQYIES